MQVPKRRSEGRRKHGRADDAHVTAEALRRLRRDLDDLEKVQRPQAVEDLTRAREMGDLSENAAYAEAKGRLMRIDGRIFSLKERIKHAILIEEGADEEGRARLGARVVLEVGGQRRTYRIVGSQEANPSKGMISQASPLGAALIGRAPGETVSVKAGGREIMYRIVDVH